MKNIVIPLQVFNNGNLTPTAKLLYGQIKVICVSKGQEYCAVSNNRLADLTGFALNTIKNSLKSLVKEGYIKEGDRARIDIENDEERIIHLLGILEEVETLTKSIYDSEDEADKELRTRLNNIADKTYKYNKTVPKAQRLEVQTAVINDYTSDPDLIILLEKFWYICSNKYNIGIKTYIAHLVKLDKESKGDLQLKKSMVQQSVDQGWAKICKVTEVNSHKNHPDPQMRNDVKQRTEEELERYRKETDNPNGKVY